MIVSTCSAYSPCGAAQLIQNSGWPASSVVVRVRSACGGAACATSANGVFGIDDLGAILTVTGARGAGVSSTAAYFTNSAASPASAACGWAPSLAAAFGTYAAVAVPPPTVQSCYSLGTTTTQTGCQGLMNQTYPSAFGHTAYAYPAAPSANSNTVTADNSTVILITNNDTYWEGHVWALPVLIAVIVFVVILAIHMCITRCVDNARITEYY
jgi:hypothetical protein